MFGWFGTQELIIILVVVLVLFGPKHLPKIGQSLGKGIREFKDAADGMMNTINDEADRQRDDEKKAQANTESAESEARPS